MMQSIYQHPTDLTLAILVHELPYDLTVLTSATLQQQDWQFEFQIIGESHRVRILHQQRLILQEVLACIPISDKSCYHLKQFKHLKTHRHQQRGYQTEVWFSDCAGPLFEKPDLEVWFPEIFHQPPVTQIKWKHHEKAVEWWTLHLYPTVQNAITVLTYSKFERMVFCGPDY